MERGPYKRQLVIGDEGFSEKALLKLRKVHKTLKGVII